MQLKPIFDRHRSLVYSVKRWAAFLLRKTCCLKKEVEEWGASVINIKEFRKIMGNVIAAPSTNDVVGFIQAVSDFQASIVSGKGDDAVLACELVTFEGLDHQLDDSTARTQLLKKSDDFLKQSLAVSH
jgi:hypothetical protein